MPTPGLMGMTSAGGKVKEKEAGMWLDKKTVSSSSQNFGYFSSRDIKKYMAN